MKNCILLGSTAVIMLVILGGCSTSDDYCCTSNDQCVVVHGKSTSCSTVECGQCVFVDPIQITVVDWKDASVGTSYNVEFTASGGIQPYSWEFTSSELDKLGWLTLIWEGENNETARLRNRAGQYPTNSTTGDGIPLTITVKDNTRRGNETRLDNQGASEDLNLKIRDVVAVPTFNPPQGTYFTDQTVRLSCDTSGATIYYTTNGTTPTTASTQYDSSNPITVTGPNNTTTTIMAIAVKEGMTQSAVASATYTIRYYYELTISSSVGGTTSPSGLQNVDLNSTPVNITATPSSGYKFVNWSVVSGTGVTFDDPNSEITTVTLNGSDATIQANFTPLVIDVYVAGLEWIDATHYVAQVWKNGTATPLTDGAHAADAASIFVSGDNVYVTGYDNNYSKVWKNGTVTWTGTQYFESTNSVFVSGTDVYLAGSGMCAYMIFCAAVWKNGTPTLLTDKTHNAGSFSVFVSGTDVYVAGYENNGTKDVAKVWKNGTQIWVTDGTNNAWAYSVFVSGGYVYIAGSESNGTNNIAKVWKNETATALTTVTELTDGTHPASALSVFIYETDVYVAGYDNNGTNNIAKVWKTGTQLWATDGTKKAEAYSVFVFRGDVYVAGDEGDFAKAWKNGTATELIQGTISAEARSVFVILH